MFRKKTNKREKSGKVKELPPIMETVKRPVDARDSVWKGEMNDR